MTDNQQPEDKYILPDRTDKDIPCGWKRCRKCRKVQRLTEFYSSGHDVRRFSGENGIAKLVTKKKPMAWCRSCMKAAKIRSAAKKAIEYHAQDDQL